MVMFLLLYISLNAVFAQKHIVSNLERGIKFNGHCLFKIQPSTMLGCMKECLATTKCQYVSYYVKHHRCEIGNDHTPVMKTDDISHLFGNRSTLEKLNIDMEACHHHACANNSKCMSLTVDEHACVISYCNEPEHVQHATILPMESAVGSTVTYKCEWEGTVPVTRVCKANGEWDVDVDGMLCCPQLYEYHSVYKCVNLSYQTKTSKESAKSTCNTEGSHLVRFTSTTMLNDFKTYVNFVRSDDPYFWIDGRLVGSSWGFEDGQHTNIPVIPSGFANGEPTGGINEKCLVVSGEGIADVYCQAHCYPMCQYSGK